MIGLAILFLPLSTSFAPSIWHKMACRMTSPCTFPESMKVTSEPQYLWKMARRSNLEDEIDYNSRRKGQGGGTGEVAAGAILGGLILGPFGALFGAQLGAQVGAKNSIDRARQEEMERLGITQDMLDASQEIGLALEQSMEGLQASRASLDTLQQFARRLEQSVEGTYDRAKREIAAGNEGEARNYLLEKQRLQEKLVATLKACAAEKSRYSKMELNVVALEERAMEMETLLRRTVGAKTIQNTSLQQYSLQDGDPLLQKFRDMGID